MGRGVIAARVATKYCRAFSNSTFHYNSIHTLRPRIKMSGFETTATIASFGGQLLKLKHKSTSTNTDMALNLYLPPQALKSGAKVPVLFYLSGLTCTGDNCSEKGFFQHGASQKGIAVVYPDTSPSMYNIITEGLVALTIPRGSQHPGRRRSIRFR